MLRLHRFEVDACKYHRSGPGDSISCRGAIGGEDSARLVSLRPRAVPECGLPRKQWLWMHLQELLREHGEGLVVEQS